MDRYEPSEDFPVTNGLPQTHAESANTISVTTKAHYVNTAFAELLDESTQKLYSEHILDPGTKNIELEIVEA